MQQPSADPIRDTKCCAPDADPRIARHFDRRMLERLAAGEMPSLHSVSRHLLGLLGDVAVVRPSVLELGCGSGALMVSLLEQGATRASGIDLSAESIGLACQRADSAGLSARAKFEVGDGASVRLGSHDWVVLDRVICCYQHVERLLENSIAAAGSRYVFSVPESRGVRGFVNRFVIWCEDLTNSLRGRPCPGYVHDLRRIVRRLERGGFRAVRTRTVGLWYIAVCERTSGPRQ
jgi:SAM-dependent methyltransferase